MTPHQPAQTQPDHAFLRGLAPRHLQLLASATRPVSFSPGQILAREGEPAEAFYLIQSGHVGLALHGGKRGSIPVQTIGSGEVLGWSWLIAPHQWHFDCKALDKVDALSLDAAWLRQQCDKDHELGYQILRHLVGALAGRLAATRLQLLDLHQ